MFILLIRITSKSLILAKGKYLWIESASSEHLKFAGETCLLRTLVINTSRRVYQSPTWNSSKRISTRDLVVVGRVRLN